jgi:hypothetical protein
VPDNLKAAIVRACLYEPAAAQTFADMAAHYSRPSSRPGLPSRATRRRWRSACWSSSGGSWRG